VGLASASGAPEVLPVGVERAGNGDLSKQGSQMSSIYDADTDEFEVEEVVEESDDDGDDDGDECSSSESPLTSNGIGRVFIVSTARTAGGHRPSCTFEGDLYDVCVSPDTGGDEISFHARVQLFP